MKSARSIKCEGQCVNVTWNYQNWSIGTSIGAGGGITLDTGYNGKFGE